MNSQSRKKMFIYLFPKTGGASIREGAPIRINTVYSFERFSECMSLILLDSSLIMSNQMFDRL